LSLHELSRAKRLCIVAGKQGAPAIIMTRFLRFLGIILFVSALPVSGRAADIAPAPAVDDWTFVTAAYLWGAGINGKSGVFGLPPADLDLSFSDILEHLNFAFMGVAEARKGRFMLGTDLTYTKLSASVDTPPASSPTSSTFPPRSGW